MVWVMQALNALIILCIPVGLYFASGVVFSDVTEADWQERLASGNWSEDARRALEEIAFKKMAARWTVYVFIALIALRGVPGSGLLRSNKSRL